MVAQLIGWKSGTDSGGTAFSVDPASPDGGSAIATDDWMILVVDNGAGASGPQHFYTNLAGFTVLRDQRKNGTLETGIYRRKRVGGDSSYNLVSTNSGARSWMLVWFRDVSDDNWIVGETGDRAVNGTTLTNVAPGIELFSDDTLRVVISGERTTADEASQSLITFTGATKRFSKEGVLDHNIAVADDLLDLGTTGDVTVTYPNTQSTNGMAVQIGIPSLGSNPVTVVPVGQAVEVETAPAIVPGRVKIQDLQVPDPNVVSDDQRASCDLIELTYSGNGDYEVALILLVRLTLIGGDHFHAYGVKIAKRMFAGNEGWMLSLLRYDGPEEITVLAESSLIPLSDIVLPGYLEIRVVDDVITGAFEHAGPVGPLELTAVDGGHTEGLVGILGYSDLGPDDASTLLIDNFAAGLPVGRVTEIETAMPIIPAKRAMLGQAVESETAVPITRVVVPDPVDTAVETEIAQPIIGRKIYHVQQAVEVEIANQIAAPIVEVELTVVVNPTRRRSSVETVQPTRSRAQADVEDTRSRAQADTVGDTRNRSLATTTPNNETRHGKLVGPTRRDRL